MFDEGLVDQMTSIEMEIESCRYQIEVGEEAKERLPRLLEAHKELFEEMMK